MEDGTSIRVRIDNQGYTYITVVQWDENGREIVYREDENFQRSETQFRSPFSPANRGQGDCHGKSN
jgi:hypothetical protein